MLTAESRQGGQTETLPEKTNPLQQYWYLQAIATSRDVILVVVCDLLIGLVNMQHPYW